VSAFLCSATHLSTLVNALDVAPKSDRPRDFRDTDPRVLFRTLLDENLASLDEKYGEGTDIEFANRYKYDPLAGRGIPVVGLLKAINCYEYQSCEHDDWEKSQAYRFCDALRKMLIRELPGYEEAVWEVT
jgi:hypothetical protein